MSRNILYLEGITLGCYENIEDKFTQELIEEATRFDRDVDPVEHDIIPVSVPSIEELPKNTTIPCWLCDFTFTSSPYHIPMFIDERGIGLKGSFCSLGCAAVYNEIYEGGAFYYNLLRYASMRTGKSISILPRAVPKTIMRKYGGTVSEQEFLLMQNRANEIPS